VRDNNDTEPVLSHAAVSYLAFVLFKNGCLKQFTAPSQAPGQRASPKLNDNDVIMPHVSGGGGGVGER
jgi:hypothetical protein